MTQHIDTSHTPSVDNTSGDNPLQSHSSPSAPVVLPSSPEKAEAEKFGVIDDKGTVYVIDNGTQRAVGQFPEEVPEHALDLYIRRYLDLKAQVDLFATRLEHVTAKEIDQTLSTLTEQLHEPAVVGDIDLLRQRVARLRERAQARKEEIKQERHQAREKAVAERERIVEQAEKIAAQDPERTQWKASGNSLRTLLEEWKNAQRHGVRIDRATEDALWKRFSHARSTFDRARRQFFHDLDTSQAQAKAKKEDIITRAQDLSTSTDWNATAGEFRKLMEEWKAAGRASRKDDDRLWEQFWNAQNAFYEARNASQAQVEKEYEENLRLKEEILEKAEALLPITDIEVAKAHLRPLQDEWDAIGRVPKADVSRIENRMRAVEQAIVDAEDAQWRRSNPETKARAEGMAGQLEELIAQLEEELLQARQAQDTSRIAEIEESLNARKAWLEQVRSVSE